MITSPFNLEFDSLEKEIRYGLQPENPCLLATYISIADRLVVESTKTENKLNILYRVANTLLDVICDTYLPEHWRHNCMDMIYRPVCAMERIAITDKNKYQVNRFKQELNTLGSYFFS